MKTILALIILISLASTAGDVGSASFDCFIDATTVPVDVDLRIRHDNGGSVNFTMQYGNLNAGYIGAT